MIAERGVLVPADTSEQMYTTDHMAWQMVDHGPGSYIGVESPLLGSYAIHGGGNDRVIKDVLRTPLAHRSFDITQLSKLREHATIPNTASMSRIGHVVDLMELTARLGEQYGASDYEILAWRLYQMEDLAHGPLSHATDIAFSEWGGNETFHAEREPDAIIYGGVTRVLKQHDINANERGMIGAVPIPPWVECSAPDICTDRWQYGVEEARLWFSDATPDSRLAHLQDMIYAAGQTDAVTITDDGEMAFKDADLARIYAKSYLLLSTEHWNDPVNRVQLHLLIETIKRSILARRLGYMSDVDNGVTRRPESYSYAIDHDIAEAMQTGPGRRDDFMYAARSLLSSIGRQERERYLVYKRDQYTRFLLDNQATEYPSEVMNGHLVDFGPPSSQIEVEFLPDSNEEAGRKVAAQITNLDEEGIRYTLNPLKNRFVDPQIVMRDGSTRRLSEIDDNFKAILEQHARVQRRRMSVRLMLASAYEGELKEGINRNAAEMLETKRADPLSPDQLRRQIEGAAERAEGWAQKAGHLVLQEAA